MRWPERDSKDERESGSKDERESGGMRGQRQDKETKGRKKPRKGGWK